MDDEPRYREALQNSLLTEGWAEAFDESRLRAWVQRNSQKLRAQAKATNENCTPTLEEHFTRMVEEFKPKTKFDLPMTEAIFRPIFNEIENSAKSIGLHPIRKVELVTSTSISPSPFARPTTGTHQLFVGPGTSAFCNYWSKAYTAIVKAIASAGPPYEAVKSSKDLIHRIKHNQEGIVFAARLALFFSVFDTVLGFGEYKQPHSFLRYRIELLRAMEAFALAHEYVHFLVEEQHLQFADDYKLELFCDELGLQISRDWGDKRQNWLAFAGVGALAFFEAVETSRACAQELAESGRHSPQNSNRGEGSHPEPKVRIANTVANVIEKTAYDQKERVARFIQEYELICHTIRNFVTSIVADAIA